jgi:hypothetical protein
MKPTSELRQHAENKAGSQARLRGFYFVVGAVPYNLAASSTPSLLARRHQMMAGEAPIALPRD